MNRSKFVLNGWTDGTFYANVELRPVDKAWLSSVPYGEGTAYIVPGGDYRVVITPPGGATYMAVSTRRGKGPSGLNTIDSETGSPWVHRPGGCNDHPRRRSQHTSREEHEMDESTIVIGCLMAQVLEHDSGEITSASEGDVRLTYCQTTESETNMLIVTREMRRLGGAGHLPIAIVRIHLNCPGQIFLFAINGLSQELRLALEQRGCDLAGSALNSSALGQDGLTESD